MKQQAAALKLHRLAGGEDSLYYWWALVSVVLQARSGCEGKQGRLDWGWREACCG